MHVSIDIVSNTTDLTVNEGEFWSPEYEFKWDSGQWIEI